MSTLLFQQTCRQHPAREAVGRCVECAGFFCRECLSEHAGRLLCGECLVRLVAPKPTTQRTWPRLLRSAAGALLGVAVAWVSFYGLGRWLLQLPSSFHEENWWQKTSEVFDLDE